MELIEHAIRQGKTMLSEHDSKKLLQTYGIPVTREVLVDDPARLDEALESIGFPVALKACSADIGHKTERDLLRLNLNTAGEARQAYDEIVAAMNGGVGNEAGGVLVQEMIKGARELVVGMTRDPQFGPCVMFGLGGIFAEVLKDATFRMAPLEKKDAFEMMDGIRGRNILETVRSMPPADREMLADILIQVGRIGLDHPAVREIDINPLILNGARPVAVDALMVLDGERRNG